MPLSSRPEPYVIPEYSLTGDLLSYLTCGLQYRYQNKGQLPPSTPVQLWFGEFIHGVMEEAYLEWKTDESQRQFPWGWESTIRNIELEIEKRLESQGLYAPPTLFCPYGLTEDRSCTCHTINSEPPEEHQLLASQRASAAINTWGQHLFPLISEAEVTLKGIRDMPEYEEGESRSDYYGVTGVADVISSVDLYNAPPGNMILNHIHQNEQLQEHLSEIDPSEYEIIIDYKGMRRPPKDDPDDPTWQHHKWQVLTYAWLRSQQPESRPVAACFLFYLNELEMSQQDMMALQQEVEQGYTDVEPTGRDYRKVQNWEEGTSVPQLTMPFREERSIRIIPISDVETALNQFDSVVADIEQCVNEETQGEQIQDIWPAKPKERVCTACDFKTYCPNPADDYSPSPQ